ncbi:hypothetical protein T484DRAFT_3644718, partial [Baffinella frigidus]
MLKVSWNSEDGHAAAAALLPERKKERKKNAPTFPGHNDPRRMCSTKRTPVPDPKNSGESPTPPSLGKRAPSDAAELYDATRLHPRFNAVSLRALRERMTSKIAKYQVHLSSVQKADTNTPAKSVASSLANVLDLRAAAKTKANLVAPAVSDEIEHLKANLVLTNMLMEQDRVVVGLRKCIEVKNTELKTSRDRDALLGGGFLWKHHHLKEKAEQDAMDLKTQVGKLAQDKEIAEKNSDEMAILLKTSRARDGELDEMKAKHEDLKGLANDTYTALRAQVAELSRQLKAKTEDNSVQLKARETIIFSLQQGMHHKN